MAVTLRQLQIFAKVASLNSVTRASDDLQLTQSAVSMALAELERYSDAPLFNRHGKRLLLNDRGRTLLPLVNRLLDQEKQIEMLLCESAQEPVGELRVGASTTIGNYLLPQLITRFSQQFPKAKILLFVANARQIENGLDNGDFDLGLIEGFQHISRLSVQKWRDDELVVVTCPQHAWARQVEIGNQDLETGDWIMREAGSGTREVFEKAMRHAQLDFVITMELGHTEAIKKAVEAGAGCACLSRMAVQRELEQGWLAEIRTPLNLQRDFIILTRADSYRSILFKTFLDRLRSAP